MDEEEKARRHREYNLKWGRANKDRINSHRREISRKNKEIINLHRREYLAKHREQKKISDKRYYETHISEIRERAREYHQRKEQEFINTYKKGKSCALCGYNEHCEILQFHHKDKKTKSFDITLFRIAKKTTEEIKKELAKCILICPNCHFLIHFRERGGT